MPARSRQQQKIMGLALAYKRGDIPASKVSIQVKKLAKSMTMKELEKYAGTKHKGLPKKVESVEIEDAMQGPRWEYEDARGVKKKGTFVKSIERSGTDVTYVFKGDDGKEDLVSGAALKKAKRIQGESKQPKMTIKELQDIISSVVKQVVNEGITEKEPKDPILTPEEKKAYFESIAKYSQYGESIYRGNDLKEVISEIKKIVEFASRNIMEESGDWFDQVTLGRHTRKMNESLKLFEKTANEVVKLQQRLEAVYEDIGQTLNKYYEIKDDSKQ